MKVVEQRDQQQQMKTTAAGAALALALLGVLVVAAPQRAHAGPASYVDTLEVELGETELEYKGGYQRDDGDGEIEHEVAIGYGVTQNWQTELELGWEKESGESPEYEGFAWKNIVKLTETGEHFVDVGLFTEVVFPDEHDEPNVLEIGPMFQKQIGPGIYNLNLIWVRDFGSKAEHDTEFEYTFQARIIGDPTLEYGIQAFGELGDWDNMNALHDQEHKLGPAVFGEFKSGAGLNKWRYNGALLLGATDDTADYTLRFSLEYEMY